MSEIFPRLLSPYFILSLALFLNGVGETAGGGVAHALEIPDAPARFAFSEDKQISRGDGEVENQVKGWRLGWHGYARVPLRLEGGPTGTRRPYLVDDNYFLSGFGYTRNNEQEWAEVFLSAEKNQSRFVIGLFASELSDWSQADVVKGQRGIALAFGEQRWRPTEWLKFTLRAGVFWERLGYLEHYDTYLFVNCIWR